MRPDDATSAPTARLTLAGADTELALVVERGRLPEVIHWGDRLGVADAAAFDGILRATGFSGANNGVPDEGYGVAVVPEEWTGWSGVPGVTGSRAGSDWAPRFTVSGVRVEGQPLGADSFVCVEAAGHPVAAVFSAEDAESGLALDLTVEMQPSGLVRANARLTNTGADGYQLERLVVALPVPLRATEGLDFAGRWSKERVPQRFPLVMGAHVREGRHGRTGADAASVLHVGERGFDFASGEVWGVHTAWSGNHLTYAEKIFTGDQVIGGGELLLPGEIVLDHGQSYASPSVFFGHGVGLDAIAAQHHEWLRRRPGWQRIRRPVTLNSWEAVYFDHRTERLVELTRRAAEVGVERFVLDDGWFGSRRDDTSGLGDWVVSPDAWPQGLHPLTDAVTGLGMEFGIWLEPEMVSSDSDLARAHPEWVMQASGRTPLPSRHQWVLNLGIPGAYAHVRDQLMALLDEYPISYIKWDHNRDLVDAGTQPAGRPGVHEQTLAFYRLVDELKAAHPGLEIESCSSGGARVDLEVMRHCDRVWVSDNSDPTDRQQMLRWTGQLLPTEALGSHIASSPSHVTGRRHSVDYRAATAVFGHLGVEWDIASATQEERDRLARWIAWYKEHRAVLTGGRLVRVDLPQAPTTYLHGVVTPECGIFGYTPLEVSAVWSIGTIPLPGLDPDATYRVTHEPLTATAGIHDEPMPDPVEMTGRQLATLGIRAPQIQPERTRILLAERI